MSFTTLFSLRFSKGLCVGIAAPPSGVELILRRLHPEEQEFARTFPPRRRFTWSLGRLALRKALSRLGHREFSILATPRGGPFLPPGFVGSVSHKQAVAVALVDRDRGWSLGVDLEMPEPQRQRIAARVLIPSERAAVNKLTPERRWFSTLLRFSLKEALYKALDPWLQRYIGYQEVGVRPTHTGRAEVQLLFAEGKGFDVDLSWFRRKDLLISLARVRARKKLP